MNLSEYFDQEKIAQKIILLEMPLIQVEGFLNLKYTRSTSIPIITVVCFDVKERT